MTALVSPVIAGHRGFKGKYPENTLLGFTKCFQEGGDVIETDLWITSDNVVVVSHDVMTKRLFEEADGSETNYNLLQTSYAEKLYTLRRIGIDEPMITLTRLLEWFVSTAKESGNSSKRLMFDIKGPNPPKILNHVVETLLKVNNDIDYWRNRIQFGIWDLKFIKYLNQESYFRETLKDQVFDIIHITVHWKYSLPYLAYNEYVERQTTSDGLFRFKTTTVSLLYLSTWSQDFLDKFMPLIKTEGIKLYEWTVNSRVQFDYLSRVATLYDLKEYGVVTDHPDKMADLKTSILAQVKPIVSVSPSVFQRVCNFIFERFIARAVLPAPAFDTKVDSNEIVMPKISKAAMWIFMFCQRLGLF